MRARAGLFALAHRNQRFNTFPKFIHAFAFAIAPAHTHIALARLLLTQIAH
jgi:hypothetical protein